MSFKTGSITLGMLRDVLGEVTVDKAVVTNFQLANCQKLQV